MKKMRKERKINKKNYIKKTANVFIASAMLSTILAGYMTDNAANHVFADRNVYAEELNSSNAADNNTSEVKWEINPWSNALYIHGVDTIPNYTDSTGANPAPWNPTISGVKYSQVIIGSDVTKVGSNAFIGDDNNPISQIDFANDNIELAEDAFKNINCEYMDIPKNIKLQVNSFNNCKVQELCIEAVNDIENIGMSGLKADRVYTHYKIDGNLIKQLKNIGPARVGYACHPGEAAPDQPSDKSKGKFICHDCGRTYESKLSESNINYKLDILGQEIAYDRSDSFGQIVEKTYRYDTLVLSQALMGNIPGDSEVINETTGKTKKRKINEAYNMPEIMQSVNDKFIIKASFREVPISVNLDGGTMHEDVIPSAVREGDTITLPEELNSNNPKYAFVGWRLYDKSGNPVTDKLYKGNIAVSDILKAYYGNEQEMINGIKTNLYSNDFKIDGIKAVAQWAEKDNKFNVIYDINDGSGSTMTEEHTLEADGATPLKGVLDLNITREGYSFAGWNTRADGSGKHLDLITPETKESFGDEPLEDGGTITLYAQWRKYKEIKVDIEFDDDNNKDGVRPDTVSYKVITHAGYKDPAEDIEQTITLPAINRTEVTKVLPIYEDYTYNENGEPTSMKWVGTETEIKLEENPEDNNNYDVYLMQLSKDNYKLTYIRKNKDATTVPSVPEEPKTPEDKVDTPIENVNTVTQAVESTPKPVENSSSTTPISINSTNNSPNKAKTNTVKSKKIPTEIKVAAPANNTILNSPVTDSSAVNKVPNIKEDNLNKEPANEHKVKKVDHTDSKDNVVAKSQKTNFATMLKIGICLIISALISLFLIFFAKRRKDEEEEKEN